MRLKCLTFLVKTVFLVNDNTHIADITLISDVNDQAGGLNIAPIGLNYLFFSSESVEPGINGRSKECLEISVDSNQFVLIFSSIAPPVRYIVISDIAPGRRCRLAEC